LKYIQGQKLIEPGRDKFEHIVEEVSESNRKTLKREAVREATELK
jgi:hypothetical protein